MTRSRSIRAEDRSGLSTFMPPPVPPSPSPTAVAPAAQRNACGSPSALPWPVSRQLARNLLLFLFSNAFKRRSLISAASIAPFDAPNRRTIAQGHPTDWRPPHPEDVKEKLDGKDAKATTVELALEPGQAGTPHRHPGPVFGYVLEGEYELGIDDQPSKVLKAGETFYEATGCLHRVSKNPAAKGNTRVLAVVLHPRDARQITIPEPKK